MNNKIVYNLYQAFVRRGFSSLRFNFRGVGTSAGHWDHGVGEVDDALAVIDAHRAPGQPLVLVGPAVMTFDVAAVPADTLVIHGEADDVVPLAAVFDWARPQVLPVTVVPGAGHFFHGQMTLLKHIVTGAWRPRP